MKRFLLLSAFALSLCGAAHAASLEEQAKHNPALAEAIKDAKAHGDYGGAYQSSRRDIENADAYLAERYEFNLRRLGMTPATARKGMWALHHKPNSACAGYIRQLTADADGPPGGPASAFIQSDRMLIMSIERSGTCERRNLD